MQHVSRFEKCLSCLGRFLFQAYCRPVVLVTVTWQRPIGLYRLIRGNVEILSRLSGARRSARRALRAWLVVRALAFVVRRTKDSLCGSGWSMDYKLAISLLGRETLSSLRDGQALRLQLGILTNIQSGRRVTDDGRRAASL
jgi:hypothetical protein